MIARTVIVYVLLGITLFIIYQSVKHVWEQRAHLTDDEIDEFVDLKMSTASNEYTRFIGHLSACEACQKRLDTAQSNRKFN